MTALDTIKSIQSLLNDLLGAKTLVVDGIFGSKSRAALEKAIAQSEIERKAAKTLPIPASPGAEFDARTEKNLATLDWKSRSLFRPFIKAAKEVAGRMGYDYVGLSGNRTYAEQAALYAQGRSFPGRVVTNAKPGYSWHNFALAMDFGVFQDGKYLDESAPGTAERVHKAVGAIAKDFGIEWGGAWTGFTDFPHFQIATGLTLAQARERFEEKGTLFV